MSSSLPVLSNLPRPAKPCSKAGVEQNLRVNFERHLHARKLKFTPERAMMLEVVLKKREPFEPEEVVRDLQRMGARVSRATVYRTFGHLQDSGVIRQVCFGNRQCLYEVAADAEASDHLMCVATGKVITLDSPKLRQLCEEIAREYGFDLVSHQVRILGLSPEGKAAAERGEAMAFMPGNSCDRPDHHHGHETPPTDEDEAER